MSISNIKKPLVAVDTVIFTIYENELHTLIIKRQNEPFKNKWTLVGGFIDVDQDVTLHDTAMRKLREKTGVESPYLEQVETFGGINRDPRGWSLTTVYFSLIPSGDIELKALKGASDTKWTKVTNNGISEKLAFDHNEIFNTCLERLRTKVLYSTLPAYLLPETFTISDMLEIYRIIMGKQLDRKSLQRRMFNAGILEDTGEMRPSGRRPSKVYRLKNKDNIHYFLRNLESGE